MSKADFATSWAEAIANDDSHGYSQYSRWNPDYDCSSLVISAYQNAGVPVYTNGARSTHNMYPVFTETGFSDVTSQVNIATGAGLMRGDVLLREGHTALYCGNGLEVEACMDENGGIGGEPGDQTGYEIVIQYYNPNWSTVLRYIEEKDTYMFELATISVGFIGDDIKLMQRLLRSRGYTDSNGHKIEIDGIFGMASEAALLKFQKAHGLVEDGICGPKSWDRLLFA